MVKVWKATLLNHKSRKLGRATCGKCACCKKWIRFINDIKDFNRSVSVSPEEQEIEIAFMGDESDEEE